MYNFKYYLFLVRFQGKRLMLNHYLDKSYLFQNQVTFYVGIHHCNYIGVVNYIDANYFMSDITLKWNYGICFHGITLRKGKHHLFDEMQNLIKNSCEYAYQKMEI